DGTSHQLQMTVVGASDAPVLSAGQISGGREDNSFTLSQDQILKALQATDPDGDRMTVASVRYAGGDATLVDNHNGTWTLTPHANWAGDLSLQVGVSDGHDTTTGTLTVPIAAVADKVTMTVAPSLSSSFEDPTLGGQMFHFADPTQWGWHTSNPSGLVEQGKGEAYGDPNHANTGVIELEGNAGEKDNLYREIETQPGAKYEFGLDVSGRSNTAGSNAAVEVWWEGALVATITPADHVFGFVRHTYELVAHSNHATIEFRAVTHDGCGPVVDNPRFDFKGFQGTEDTPLPIRLSVETTDKDGSETITTSVRGLPAGFVISDGTTGHQLTSSGPTQLMDMQGWDLAHIVVTPVANFHGDVKMELVSTSTEASNHDQSPSVFSVPLNFAGVNDNPTVQITAGSALQEGSAATSSEQITGSDVDGDRTSVDSAWLSSHGWSSSDGGVSYSKAGTYGTATVTVASGQVSYLLNNAAGGATDQLSEGQSVSDQFQVQITDGHQGTAGTAVATALFNVQGTNDTPVVTAGTATPLAEGSSGTATSILTMRDPDTNDPAPTVDTTWLVSHGWSSTDGGSTYTRAGTYGTATLNVHTSTVSYHLDNTAGGATDHLAEGQSVHDDFGIQVVDSHGASAMVTPTFGVMGTNDAPTVSASNPSLGSAVEEKDGAATPVIYTEQQLLTLVGATDRDGGDSLHVTHVTAESGFGSFAKLSNGNWQYTPPADAHKASVSVSVTVEDAHKGSSTAQAVLDVRPATDSAKASLDVTTEAQVMHFSAPGQHAFKETGAGPMSAFSLEVMAVGDPTNKGSTTGGQGQVLFNLSAPPSDNNILSLWRPAALSIAFKSSDHETNPPLDLTTGQHRLTLTWDSATGVLTLYDNGKEYQHWDNIHKGETIPANTIATVGQKMGEPGSKTGFQDAEQFHGDLFSVTLASQKVGAGDVGVPLATHMPRNQLLMDLREANGQVVDTLAAGSAHPITAPNVGTATQQVSTTASLPPSGARLNLNLAVTPPADPDDHISRELLRGLPPGTVLSDGSGGHSFTVPANGEVSLLTDLNGWQHLNQLSAQLPTGYHQNLPLQLVVETTGPNGAISLVSTNASVLFDPSAQIPALPPLAAPADVDQAPTVAADVETTNEDTSYSFKAADFGYADRDGDALHHITLTSLPPASEGQLMLGGVAVHAGQEILAARIGDLSFQPAKDFNGDSHFGFSASDGSKDSAAAQMGVHVSPVADQTTAKATAAQDIISTRDLDVQQAWAQSGHGGLELHAFGVGTSPIDAAAGLALTETQLATTHHQSDPLTGASSDVLELHTDHGTVVQTLTTHADGSQHVALDTTGLDASSQAALPA
ncbi:MAG: tandem-95 repeat protein, partial [Synechococcaceae bacterium WB9_2_170]|nr:tandem-95 repeat protein [Synechococcaceae bacterium WB9_2_170]